VNYSYAYIHFENPTKAKMFYKTYGIHERIGPCKKKIKFGLSSKKKLPGDDNLMILLVCHCLIIMMIETIIY
jgi:hypothetical protein